MIYLTGDLHGKPNRLNNRRWKESKILTRNDYLIQLGDFGLFWNVSNEEKYWLKWLNNKPYTTLFIDGNHENFNILAGFKEVQGIFGPRSFLGISPFNNIKHIKRGSVLEIEGKKILCMGGATSIDKGDRLTNISWWQTEIFNWKDEDRIYETLEYYNWEVDYIFTHTLPKRIVEVLNNDKFQYGDSVSNFFDNIYDKLKFEHWYAGHFHMDRTIEKYNTTILYNSIISL
jgi:hypothetical protein